MGIITSILDNDLYKFTMQQAVMKAFPYVNVKYQFVNRNGIDLTPYREEIREEIGKLGSVSITEEELNYLKSLDLFSDSYLYALSTFYFNTRSSIELLYDKFELTIRGNWFQTILYEVPILAIINEVYYRHNQPENWIENGLVYSARICNNYNIYKSKCSEFGTRRRFSKAWQDYVIHALKSNGFNSTSNVHFAKKYNMTPIGTMAHEWIQAGQALAPSLKESQRYMLGKWHSIYGKKLNCALTDTIGIDAFLKEYGVPTSENFPVLRHDSGCPFTFVNKVLKHCKKWKLNIPHLVFSDGLDLSSMCRISEFCFDKKVGYSFGIGTYLTNNVGATPMQNVIKMVECNGKPVAKLSDSKGKYIGDEGHIKELKKAFGVK